MSREEAISILNHNVSAYLYGTKWSEALEIAIKALEQEPCEDAISREAVLEKAVYTETEEGWCGYTVDVDYIKSLSSVTPKEKTGRWIFDEILDRHYYCSECKSMGVDYWDYCPECGARMDDEEEVNKIDE